MRECDVRTLASGRGSFTPPCSEFFVAIDLDDVDPALAGVPSERRSRIEETSQPDFSVAG